VTAPPRDRPPRVTGPADDGLVPDDTWLELAVTCDPEAVEAVSEIFSRVAPGGVSVEPGFFLVDEGLGATVDPAAPATVRAYLPARDAVAARRATATVDAALGHLQAFGCVRSASCGRRPSTSPTGRRPGSATWASYASGGGS